MLCVAVKLRTLGVLCDGCAVCSGEVTYTWGSV